MAKLQDMFTQARRAQSGGGIGFLGKNRAESKAHAASIVVEFPSIVAGGVEAALKAGADGLLFGWNGQDEALLATVKQEIEAAKASNEGLIVGLRVTDGLDTLERENLSELKEMGIQYIILPFNAPVRLLAQEKELEKVITVPMRSGDFYPIFIRNLAAFDGISAVLLDFGVSEQLGTLTIEDALNYQAVREAVRFPAFFNVTENLSEDDFYTLRTLGIQAVVLAASNSGDTAQIKTLRALLEKVYQEEKEKEGSGLRKG
ncbi:MAG: hypothetical protein M3Y39_07345 [Chloroflexota bacterium]|nr:hypothetical protein [Chloroflexota bacterium]